MKVIRPVTITDATLISSTVPEADYPAWAGGTTYAIGDRVIKGHKVWEGLQASNTGHDPETDTSVTPWWLEVSSTNRWKMFDQQVNSATTATTSMTVVIAPGAVNALGLVELVGDHVRVQVSDGATVIYDQTQAIDDTPIEDWLDYFYEPYDPAAALIFDDLPQYLSGTITVTVTGTGTVACGGLVVGAVYDVGTVLSPASAGIIDFSKKDTNVYGVTKVVRRAFSKRASLKFMFDKPRARRLQALFADLRATPCLWIGEDDTQTYAPLAVYGFWRDFQIEIEYHQKSFCSMELEGMI